MLAAEHAEYADSPMLAAEHAEYADYADAARGLRGSWLEAGRPFA
jgi:hypothetical protein